MNIFRHFVTKKEQNKLFGCAAGTVSLLLDQLTAVERHTAHVRMNLWKSSPEKQEAAAVTHGALVHGNACATGILA